MHRSSVRCCSRAAAAHPRTVLQKMREGALKCQGPALLGLVLCLFCRKREYFILWRTRPPEMVISSARTTTCVPGASVSPRNTCTAATPPSRLVEAPHNLVARQDLLGDYGRQAPEHVRAGIDDLRRGAEG